MKLGIIGDIHLSATPPGRRSETYLADVQAKLEEIARADDVDMWLLIGDIFHHKRANRVPHWLVSWTWDWLSQLAMAPGPSHPDRGIYIVPGNHDLADGSIESIERQPLGVLERHPSVVIARGIYAPNPWPEQPPYVPHANILTTDQHFMAVPGTGAVCDATADLGLELEDVAWVFAHAPIDRGDKPWATYDAATLPLHPNTKGVIYGHQHDEPGAWARPDGKLVIATGAVSRGSVTEANHQPAWVVLDTDGVVSTQVPGAVEVRPIACARPAADVYRWAERTAEREADATVAAFVQALDAETLEGFSTEALADSIGKRADLDDAVRAEAVAILTDSPA